MCGRFFIKASIDDLSEYYGSSSLFLSGPKGEIFPGEEALTLTNEGLKLISWGFPLGNKLNINARMESVFEKPLYSKSILTRRCLIPANFFYEWNNKLKYLIGINNTDIFSMAGIYDVFQDGKGVLQERFVIITTQANQQMKKLHPRMPVIIPREKERIYLNPKCSLEDIKALLLPYEKENLSIEPSSGFEQLSLW